MDVAPTKPVEDADRLRRLLEVGRSLTAELDLDLVLERVLETARDLTGAAFAALGVLDDRRRELAQFHTSGDSPHMRAAIGHLPRGLGVLGVLIDQPEAIRVHDVSAHPRSYGFPPGHPPMTSFLGVPILVRGEAWGNLYLANKAGGEDFDDADLESIGTLAQWAGIAIDNARLFGTSEQRRKELEQAVRASEAAMDIALAVGGETDLEPILQLIVKRARALVNADALLIWLVDGDDLVVAAHAGNASPPSEARMPIFDSTAGQALLQLQATRIDDVTRGLKIDPEMYGVAGARSALIVPLVFRGRGLGVLCAFDHIGDDSTFSAQSERALRAFAASGATAVATARTVERQRLRDTLAAAEGERRRWARDLHDGTLQGLGGLKLVLNTLRRTPAQDHDAILVDAIAQVESEITALREVIADLRPSALDELGLQAAVRTLAERVAARHGLHCRLDLELGDRRLEPEVETIAYRIVQEALTNVVKHADATSVRIALRDSGAGVEVHVEDDGRGADSESLNAGSGFGVIGMRERAALVGGTLDMRPRAGGGTDVALVVPRT